MSKTPSAGYPRNLLLVALLAAATAPLTAAQDPEDAGEQLDRPIAELLDDLETALEDRETSRDDQAVRLLRQLGAACDGDLDKKERKKIRTTAAAALNRHKVRPPTRREFYAAATDVLVKAGRQGAMELMRAFEDTKRYPKYQEDWFPVRTLFLVGVGRTQDSKAAQFLCKLVIKTDEDAVLVACGEALGHFQGAKPPLRKEIVKILTRRYSDVEVSSQAIPPLDRSRRLQDDVESYKRTLRAIQDPWNAVLTKLTGAAHTDGKGWDEWWREHRNRKWK